MKTKKSIVRRITSTYVMISFVLILFVTTAFTTTHSEWGPWTVISYSHTGIEARVKKCEYNEYARKYRWEIQFRNNYTEDVVFNYGYTPTSKQGDCVTDHRKHIDAGDVSDVTAALLDESYHVHVCIDNVEAE